MSCECDKCSEHCLDCTCYPKDKPEPLLLDQQNVCSVCADESEESSEEGC